MLRRVLNLFYDMVKKENRISYRKNDDAYAIAMMSFQVESMPQKNNDVYLTQTDINGDAIITGEKLKSSGEPIKQGEYKINGLDKDNNFISWVYLKNSGDIEFKNQAGITTFSNDGAVAFANGATITSDGIFVSAKGISSDTHTHGLSSGTGDDGGALSGNTEQPK